ncbi:hypothetical protein [Muriicola sp. Z0-33]|uniref:hypothetical protein n=1 Tax=Muriicola sp. Z0-33 TaxID=2816957 RepID=UPI002238414E|nr:hypothetical protein [Muriicola sp. Z0-33]MCW5517150.1 hypothetical protein [Muriicola sp. Z0-33]
MKSHYYPKLILGAIILTALNIIYTLILTSGEILNLSAIKWSMLANFLIVVVLGIYVSKTNMGRFNLVLSVFVILYLVGCFNLAIEAYIFNVTDRSKTIEEILQGLLVAALFAPILIYLLIRGDAQGSRLNFRPRSTFGWLWRVLVGVVLYLIFYLVAGMILQATYPELMDFYKDKLPSIDLMILTQFPRGLIFVVIAILVVRTSNWSLTKNAILIGLIFSILGAIAPLIPPSEYMPSNIRLVHGVEVGISNFIYGGILGFLLGQKQTSINN